MACIASTVYDTSTKYIQVLNIVLVLNIILVQYSSAAFFFSVRGVSVQLQWLYCSNTSSTAIVLVSQPISADFILGCTIGPRILAWILGIGSRNS